MAMERAKCLLAMRVANFQLSIINFQSMFQFFNFQFLPAREAGKIGTFENSLIIGH